MIAHGYQNHFNKISLTFFTSSKDNFGRSIIFLLISVLATNFIIFEYNHLR